MKHDPFNRDQLKAAIDASDLAIYQVADAAGYSRQILYDYLAGRASMSADKLRDTWEVLCKL